MQKLIYFDNAATVYPKPEIVYETMDNYYRNYGFSSGRGQYTLARKVNMLISDTRENLRKFFNCKPNQNIVFTHSATEALNIILQGLNWHDGDNVYITHFEHNSVLRVLYHLKKRIKINICYLDVEKKIEGNKTSLYYDMEKIEYQFQKIKPDVIILNHASNVCGLVTPIEAISQLAKKYSSDVVVDCAQTAGLLNIDMQKLCVDYVIFAGHKTLYGPFGVSGFVIDNESNLEPLMFGGTGIESAKFEVNETPDKFEVGSINSYAISGLYASLNWINRIGREQIYLKDKELTNLIFNCLSEFDNIRYFLSEDQDNQIGIISFVINNYSSDSIGQILNSKNIAVRTGLHCAPKAHQFLGTFPTGTVRLSLSYFNKSSDIKHLYDVLEYIYENQ